MLSNPTGKLPTIANPGMLRNRFGSPYEQLAGRMAPQMNVSGMPTNTFPQLAPQRPLQPQQPGIPGMGLQPTMQHPLNLDDPTMQQQQQQRPQIRFGYGAGR